MRPPAGNSDLVASLPVQLLTAGTAACIADLATFPLDTAKVRLQVQGEVSNRMPIGQNMHVTQNLASAQIRTITTAPLVTSASSATAIISNPQYRGLVGTISTITRQEGPRALYNGLSAGLQRQMCFASVRLGLYDTTKNYYGTLIRENPEGLQIFTRVLAGITTGGAAVLLAQPTDVVKVRFQAQSRSTNGAAPRYRTITGAYKTIYRQEGVIGLWKGTMPNIGRNAIVNVSEIVCYDIIKDCLMLYASMHDNIYCHFTAAFFAGLVTTVASSPVDVIKTRYMNSPPGTYKSSIDCTLQMFRNEGSAAFYKGFAPNFARMLSWNLVLWITYEQLKKVTFHKRDV